MAFCNNCGAQLPEDGKFCTTCGAKVEEAKAAAPVAEKQTAPTQAAAPVQKEKKPVNKKLFIILGAAVLALIVVVAVIVVIVNIVKTNQAIKDKTLVFEEEFFEVEFTGYDTLGTVAFDFTDEFEDAAYDALGFTSKKDRKKNKAQEKYLDLKYAISYEISKEEALSNGDEVTIKVVLVEDYDGDLDIVKDNAKKKDKKDADVIIKEVELKYTVEGLPEVIKHNPFDDLEITTSGADGSVWVDWSYVGEYSLSYYDFDCDNDYDLSIGDSYTISISEDVVDYMLDYYGVLLTETSKTYKVESADKYVEKIDDISSDILDEMKEMAVDEIEDEVYWIDCTYSDYEYLGMYYLTLKEDEYGDDNIAMLVYKVTATPEDEDFGPFNAYVGCRCYNIYETADGEQSVDSWCYAFGEYEYISEDSWDDFYGYFTIDALYDDMLYEFEDEYEIEISDELSSYEEEEEEEVVAGEYATIQEFFESEEGIEAVEAQEEFLLETYTAFSDITFSAEGDVITYEYTYLEEQDADLIDIEFTVEEFESDFEDWEEITGISEITIQVVLYNADGTVLYDESFSNF